ncbi:hypothetical protein [Methyloprofundus sp.]|uniref:hypothetical protein n=1 Tax=Methyloprofundus sp. TaxID=2020875 RepID=UPI003D10E835
MMRITKGYFALACTLFATSLWTLPANASEPKPVHFAKGASSATLEGLLKGDQTINYTLRAKAGQNMSVMLKTSNPSSYFNVLPPGSKGGAIFVGSMSGNDWTGTLVSDGDYTIRVYLMRNAARRNETAKYALTFGITGAPAAAKALESAPASTDTKVKGTPYHATGQVSCSMGDAPRGTVQCDFGVIRGKSGNAQVHVTPPGGLERVLTFEAKKVVSEGSATVKSSKSGDLWLIEVNDYEHYQIPDAVISGG